MCMPVYDDVCTFSGPVRAVLRRGGVMAGGIRDLRKLPVNHWDFRTMEGPNLRISSTLYGEMNGFSFLQFNVMRKKDRRSVTQLLR